MKARTRQSSPGSIEMPNEPRVTSAGASAAPSQCATTRPSALPTTASSRLSVSSCRTMRTRGAPIATRTATSRRLARPLASSSVETFAQATSRTIPTTKPIATSGSRMLSRSSVCPAAPGSTTTRGRASGAIDARAYLTVCFTIASRRGWTPAALVPGFRRPIISTHQNCGSSGSSPRVTGPYIASGSVSAGSWPTWSVPWNPCRAMPAIVKVMWLTTIERPTVSGAAPKRRCQ